MTRLTKCIAAAMILAPLATTMAYADTGSSSGSVTTTVSSTTSASTTTTPQVSHFDTEYQANQQTEAALLVQAQKVQSANSAKYATFVNSVQAQVSALYASEQALVQTELALKGTTPQPANQGLVQQEQSLYAQLKALVSEANQNPNKTRQNKQALRQAEAQIATIRKAIERLNVRLKAATSINVNPEMKSFANNIASLRAAILGLQADEIRVTKAWIASGQTSVTGSVYGSSNTTSST